MLAGIKIGKKKQKRPAQEEPLEPPSVKKTANLSAAQELKRTLATIGIVSSETVPSDQHLLQCSGRITKSDDPNISEPIVVLTGAAIPSDRPIFQKGK